MKEVYFLRCRECGKKYPNQPQSYCEECFAPLEVSYDYEVLRQSTSREAVSRRAFNMWRYSEFLRCRRDSRRASHRRNPAGEVSQAQLATRCKKSLLQERRGLLPFSLLQGSSCGHGACRARRFGFETIGCSSTGNLANAVAAQGAQQGFDTCVFIPADLEPAKILNTAVFGARIVRINGNYDHVNRSAPRSRTNSVGASSTSTCGRTTPKAPRPRLRNRRATWLGTPDNVVVPWLAAR